MVNENEQRAGRNGKTRRAVGLAVMSEFELTEKIETEKWTYNPESEECLAVKNVPAYARSTTEEKLEREGKFYDESRDHLRVFI